MSTYTEARNKLDNAKNFIEPDSPTWEKINAAIDALDAAELAETAEEFVNASRGIGDAIVVLREVMSGVRPNGPSEALDEVNRALEVINPISANVSRLIGGEPATGLIDDDDDGSVTEPNRAAGAGEDANPAEPAEPVRESFRPLTMENPVQSGKTPDQMIDEILEREGGFVNHAADRGGPTKFGVTQRTLSSWRGQEATIEDVRSLAITEAKEIYRTRYYVRPKIDKLPSLLQPLVFDMSINHGPGTAVKLLQRVLNDKGFACSVDGGIGDETIGCTQSAAAAHGTVLINFLVDKRVEFYNRIVDRDETQKVFLKGWMKRANEFRVA
jgi:hypothetical protein